MSEESNEESTRPSKWEPLKKALAAKRMFTIGKGGKVESYDYNQLEEIKQNKLNSNKGVYYRVKKPPSLVELDKKKRQRQTKLWQYRKEDYHHPGLTPRQATLIDDQNLYNGQDPLVDDNREPTTNGTYSTDATIYSTSSLNRERSLILFPIIPRANNIVSPVPAPVNYERLEDMLFPKPKSFTMESIDRSMKHYRF